jgi:tetratricopeptide (TPR) repeat protein
MRGWRPALLLLLAGIAAPAMAENPLPAAPPPTPAPFKVNCIDDVRIGAGQGYWFCLYVHDEKRLNVALGSGGMAIEAGPLSVSSALSILANPVAAKLHPVILDYAGDGLEKLRSEGLKDIRARDFKTPFNQNSLVSLNPGVIGRLIDKSRALIQLGYRDEAMKAFTDVLSGFDKKVEARDGDALSDEMQWRWFSLRQSYAGLLVTNGDPEAGIAAFATLAADDRIQSRYRTNAKVNLAAHMAENGQYASALKVIDAAKAEFDGRPETAVSYKLGGSDRHFAWIRACALTGLGRSDEAKPLINLVLASPEKPAEYWADIYATSSIERRLYSCMGDVDRMVAFLKKGGTHPLYGSYATLYLQPGIKFLLPRQDAFLKQVQAHPDMKAMLDDIQILPDSVLAALNRWY